MGSLDPALYSQFGFGSRRAKRPTKIEKSFSCGLDVHYGGLGISKLQFLIKKSKKKKSCFLVYFLLLLVIKTLDPDLNSLEMLDPDPQH
jgi:hypothetical protein